MNALTMARIRLNNVAFAVTVSTIVPVALLSCFPRSEPYVRHYASIAKQTVWRVPFSAPINSKLLSTITAEDSTSVEVNSFLRTCISFYKFTDIQPVEVDYIVETAKKRITEMNLKGTLIVSQEGINGQFCVPPHMLSEFKRCLATISPKHMANIDLNIDKTLDYSIGDGEWPFNKLLVKRKKEILTSGLSEPCDWNDAGPELSPKEWHNAVAAMQSENQQQCNRSVSRVPVSFDSTDTVFDGTPLLLDCRNTVESDIGTFRGSIKLETNTFSETWDRLDTLLKEVPRNAPILTFCTGGIRCVKVNAYLKQKLGYTNIARLEKGIIGYEQWVREQYISPDGSNQNAREDSNINAYNNDSNDCAATPFANEQPKGRVRKNCVPSLFDGKNFLFDRRRLSMCATCDNK